MTPKTKTLLLSIAVLIPGSILANLMLVFIYSFNENTAVKIYLALSILAYVAVAWLVVAKKQVIFPVWFKIAYVPLTFILFFLVASQPWERTFSCPEQIQVVGDTVVRAPGQTYYFWEKGFWSAEADKDRCQRDMETEREDLRKNPPPPSLQ